MIAAFKPFVYFCQMMEAAYPSGLQPLLEKIDRLRAEIDKLRPLSPEQEARVMQKFRLDWNYHSNSIEGNSLTYGETIAFLMEGLTAKGKPFKDHLDIKGHNEGIDYLMEIIKNRQHLTEKAIRELHKIILVEPYKTPAKTPDGQAAEKTVHLGQYKSLPNHVKTPTGEIHYYATPEETPAKMSDLMAWLQEHQEKKDLHPVMLAAIFHYRFVAIHPFDDGNGRMSRLLMNLLLMHYHYPPVVIKQQERNAYYYALRQADAGDLSPFIEFIGENLIHSLEIYLRGARGESIEETGDWEKQVTLLKKAAEGKKPNSIQQQIDRKDTLAQWLKVNIPILWREFNNRFSPFISFFNSASCRAYLKYGSNEIYTPLPLDNGSLVDVATGIIDGLYKPEIMFLFDYKGFIYANSIEETPFEPPKLFLKIDNKEIVLASQKWSISPVLPISPIELQPIHDKAQQFYKQIEQAIEK